jgi:MFS family permease
MTKPERFPAFSSRDFRFFWVGHLISFSGTWMHATALSWLVYSLTKSPFYLGLVSAASSLPILLFSLFGGAAADRFKKRNLLILTQAASIFPALVVGLLTSLGVIAVWHVMVLAFMLGTANAFDFPTRQSFLLEMVERKKLMNAVALNSAAFNASRMIGPVLAGVIITTMGLPVCFYINAGSYVAMLIALLFIKSGGQEKAGRISIVKDIREGMDFIRKEPSVSRPLLLVGTFSLFGLPFVVLLPVFAEEILHAGARGYGFLLGASGIGALSSALIIAFKGEIQEKRRLISVASLVFPAALILFSMSRSYAISLLIMVVVGLAVVAFLATANTTMQLKSPDKLRGRVMSVYTLVFRGMVPIGSFIVGAVATLMGTVSTLKLAASVCLAVSLFLIIRGSRNHV